MNPLSGTPEHEILRLRGVIDLLVLGLSDVVNPMQKIERELPEGCVLDGGACVNYCSRPATYVSIAKDTLYRYEKAMLTCHCGCGETDLSNHHPTVVF